MSKPERKLLPLWRNRDYLLLWGGQIVSMTGSQISQLVFPLLILAHTHSPAQAGIAAALQSLPYLVLSLPAGALVDRWDRKRVMIFCNLGRGLCVASVPLALWSGHLTLIHLYLVCLLEGILFVFFDLAEVSSLPQVVAREQLPTASAQNIATMNIASLLGSPLGGALYGISRLLPFLFDALSYFCSVLSLLFIQTAFQQKRTMRAADSLGSEIKEGLKWLWGQPLIRSLALLLGTCNLLTEGLPLIIIILGQQLHASEVELGLLFSAIGLAGVLGTIVAPWLQHRLGFQVMILFALWAEALASALLIVAPNLLLLAIVLAFLFFLFTIFDVLQRSQRMALLPDALQGRVNSVYRLVVLGGRPVSLALTGFLLQYGGTLLTMLLITGGLILLAISATFNPHLRRADADRAIE